MKNYDDLNLMNHTMRSLIDNTRDFMFVKNKDFVYIGASNSFAVDCVGKANADELLGKTDFEIFEDQTLAAKYRCDDEQLFSSLKPMLEYRESYPDNDGHKRYCLTSKYVILDDEGKPAGIFGQCHDITEQVEVEKNERAQQEILQRQYNMFRAMKDVYNIILYFDFKKDTYINITGNENANDYIKAAGKLSEVLPAWMSHDLEQSVREGSRKFFDLSTMSSRLTEKGTLTKEVETINFGWLRISLIPVDYDQQGRVETCLWVSEKIGEEVKLRADLENRVAILDALRNIYHVCMFWNFNENSYFRVSGQEYINPQIVPESGELNHVLDAWMEDDFDPSVRKSYKEFFNTKTLPQRLKEKGVIVKEIHTLCRGWMRTLLIPVNFDSDGNVVSCLWVGECIDDEKRRDLEQQEALKAAKHAAETDALTGLFNRGGSEYLIQDMIAEGQNGLLCLFDVDAFKHINDQYGHWAGDDVLKRIADGMRSVFRKEDVLARFGGDEFVVFALGIDDADVAERCLERFLYAIESESVASIGHEHIQISLGAVLVKNSEKINFSTIYQQCDTAMYLCKNETNKAYSLVSDEGKSLGFGFHKTYK